MDIEEQINNYFAGQPQPKRSEMQELHHIIMHIIPATKLWFLDGTDEAGKTVSNPSVGYGLYYIKYADGSTRPFYQIGLSGNKTGISVYILGLTDKTYLTRTYGASLGRATITGYCIRFKTLKDININILEAAIQHGVKESV